MMSVATMRGVLRSASNNRLPASFLLLRNYYAGREGATSGFYDKILGDWGAPVTSIAIGS
jgi:hypothetical protein